jgi:hypothetical protein
MLKKYYFYKNLLKVYFAVNVFFVLTGAVFLARSLKSQAWAHSELFFVGLGVLIFGFLAPYFLFKRVEKKIKEWEAVTQKLVAQWVAAWTEEHGKGSNEFEFWLNLALVSLESMKGQFKNPYFHFVSQMAPYIRQAMEQQNKGASSRKKTRLSKAS